MNEFSMLARLDFVHRDPLLARPLARLRRIFARA